ncbi:MAG: MATE family efflux transporter [Litorivicinus sp.]
MRLMQEWSAIWRIAGPLIVSQLCYTGMGFVDALVGGRSGLFDLAGVAVGTGIWLPIALFLSGLAYAATPLVAKGEGRGESTDAPFWVGQGLVLMLALGLLASALLLLSADTLLGAFGTDPDTRLAGTAYLAGIALGAPAFCLFQSLRSALIGLGQTRLEMIIAISMLALNLPLSAALVFGWWGIPKLGSFGIGLGTALVFWLGSAALWMGLCRGHPEARPRWMHLRFQRARIQALFSFGWPIGLAIAVEASVFSIIALLLAPLGAVAVASHTIALNLSAMFFMLPLGIGLAATSRVGYLRGTGDLDAAFFSTKAAIGLGLAIASVTCVLTFAFRVPFATLYGSNPEVTALAAGLMIFAAIYQLPDSVQVIAAGALRGFEDSKGPLVVSLIAYWLICLPGGLWLGREGPAMGAAGFWIFLIIGLTLASIGMGIRLRQIRRRLN